jgi:FKBP-type peptidyl-prolyl cis-trans isomerase (trigger factor)
MCFKTTDITVNKENFKKNIKNVIKQYYKEEYDEKITTDYFNAQTIKQLIRHACRLQPMIDTKSEFMQIEKDNQSYFFFNEIIMRENFIFCCCSKHS